MSQLLIDFTLHNGEEHDYYVLEKYMTNKLNELNELVTSFKWGYDKDKTQYIITYDEKPAFNKIVINMLVEICNVMYRWSIVNDVLYEHKITDRTGNIISYERNF